MSNPLSVRRVRIQEIDAAGDPIGEESFGVLAADSYQSAYNDSFKTLNDLNQAISQAESILKVADTDAVFEDADHRKIGRNNFYGKDWMLSVAERNFYCVVCHRVSVDPTEGYDTCANCAKRI